ncbi:Metal reductase [Zhongshania aliphaticivorans]|uniref:Metal reductase n=1 Tax=Zhongshania aliphaticivorans TaxID=1470434 RepID=A0A5S9NA01_9GAMM|nr:NADH:flavin oxidoreductase [Zhongshania aliphaticivorans]CAA0080131.1 Metal reductase [Zhongshania aliphaticivorans]CAA0085866.1 Metal reductase [Zhongshania aliphaticivorans]
MSHADYLSPASINSLQLKNRFIKAGTFENMTPGGVPGANLNNFHGKLADGDIAMTTLGYCAVENDGRLNENMMYMHEGIRPELTALIADLHQRGTKVSGQMGHCGGFSKNKELQRRRPLGPSFGINGLGLSRGMLFCDAMTLDDIESLIKSYHQAAIFMKSVGFDALEIHFGHGYGLCQFISPKTNKRRDQYGGNLENRMRLPLQVLAAVRDAVGDDFPLLGKISMTEGVRGGLHYDEAIAMCKFLDKAGIDGIITSGGSSTMNPMIMFRGGNILPGMLRTEKSPLMRLLLRLMGKSMFKNYPYSELYFLQHAKRIREAVSCKMIYVGGASSNTSFMTLMEQGFDFIQLGRTLLSDPDLPHQARAKSDFVSRCTHCNDCISTIESTQGIHCTQFPS